MPLRAAKSLTRLWVVVKSDIHRVTQPLLIYCSADDHIVEPSNSTWLLANTASREAEEVVLEESFHMATLDNDAPQILAGSLAFARSVELAVMDDSSDKVPYDESAWERIVADLGEEMTTAPVLRPRPRPSRRRASSPPEPPPLPKLDLVGRLAWGGTLGGPLLLFGGVLVPG